MASYSTDPGNRGVADLERDVDAERARVSDTLDALQAKASVSNVLEEVVRVVGENGGEVSRNLGRALRDNPLPALLTGVGLVWLMAGSGRSAAPTRYGEDWDEDEDQDEDYYYRGYSGVATPPPPRRLGDETVPAGSDSATWGDAPEIVEEYPLEAEGDDGPGLRQRAAEAIGGVRERAAGAAGSVRERAADAAGSVRERAAGLSEAAQSGLSYASGAASDARHAAARRAQAARRRAQRAGHDAREGLDTLMRDQPLVLGALALAVGAALGSALPRSRTEDRLFGEQAARARRSVRDMAEDEGRKVMATAGAVASEARTIADEAAAEITGRLPEGSEAVHEADRRVREAAERLKQAGVAEAERQGLGHPDTTTS